MKIVLNQRTCTVIKEPNDPRCYGAFQARGESTLFHHVKNILNANGFDLIKKRMSKDGHMVDDVQQYIRTRKPKEDGLYAIWNTYWAIAGAEEDFNKNGEVRLYIEWGDQTPEEEIVNFHREFQKTFEPKKARV